MSLVFKKQDYPVETDSPHVAGSPANKESALSLLLERSKGKPGTENVDSSPTSPVSSASARSPTSTAPRHFGDTTSGGIAVGRGDTAGNASSNGHNMSVRIPSASYRKGSVMQSSLQQQRERARTGDSSIQNTPNSSSVLGTSAGYGHLFGAGEIGSVSSPRHFSIPISKDKFDPGSVEERFIVNIPSSQSGNANGSGATASATPRERKGSISSLSRSMSKVSISRSNSRSSTTSFTSLRRFMEKPWKHDDLGSPGSGVSVNSGSSSPPPSAFQQQQQLQQQQQQSINGNGSARHSRKNSVVSYNSGDDDSLVGSYESGGSILSSTPNASLLQLDQAYANQHHGHNTVHSRNKQSLKAYGRLGKTLGEGAGGHVKIIRGFADNQIYAVKEFRARHPSESAREYNKKVGAEYCLGLTLKHPNIVNTVDIIYETEKVYQIMEYGAYDLFAIVMSGKMTQAEVYCDFRQLMEGIRYLHNSGLAHRDLKLDNCVVTDKGIVKIIDFGSSVVYKYPESDKIYDCDGVVGSDPYLAPEAAGKGRRYTPTPTDIWSAAIVLCCMLMRKFPWKAPRLSDNAFKAFVTEEEDGTRLGLEKLLQNLPDEVKPLLTGMLDLDPAARFDINRCWEEPWMTKEPHCTINAAGEVVPAPGHTHTSVSFEDAHIAMLEKKNRKAKKGEKMW